MAGNTISPPDVGSYKVGDVYENGGYSWIVKSTWGGFSKDWELRTSPENVTNDLLKSKIIEGLDFQETLAGWGIGLNLSQMVASWFAAYGQWDLQNDMINLAETKEDNARAISMEQLKITETLGNKQMDNQLEAKRIDGQVAIAKTNIVADAEIQKNKDNNLSKLFQPYFKGNPAYPF